MEQAILMMLRVTYKDALPWMLTTKWSVTLSEKQASYMTIENFKRWWEPKFCSVQNYITWEKTSTLITSYLSGVCGYNIWITLLVSKASLEVNQSIVKPKCIANWFGIVEYTPRFDFIWKIPNFRKNGIT